jgi:nicotinate-nucleotide adenylyltransferase
MAAMAVETESGLAVTDIELARTGTTFTWDTLGALSAAGYRPSQLFFITGADAFSAIATWHRYPDLLDRAHFVVVTRPGHALLPAVWPSEVTPRVTRIAPDGLAPPLGDEGATRVWLVEAPTPDVSSSVVRDRIRKGGDVASFVLPRVAAHIRRHGLYEGTDVGEDLLRGYDACQRACHGPCLGWRCGDV